MLNATELTRVEAAVREAERGTAGEIVLVLARRAGRYRSVAWAYGLAAATVTLWAILLAGRVSPLATALAPLGIALLVRSALAHDGLRHALTPRPVRNRRCREAAEREFASHGMTSTRGRTGILLFVAATERYAEVIGDVGISPKVPEAEWREIVEALVSACGRGEPAAALENAVARLGAILRIHAPAAEGDPDELPNRVVLL